MDTEFEFGADADGRIVYVRPVDINDLPEEVQEEVYKDDLATLLAKVAGFVFLRFEQNDLQRRNFQQQICKRFCHKSAAFPDAYQHDFFLTKSPLIHLPGNSAHLCTHRRCPEDFDLFMRFLHGVKIRNFALGCVCQMLLIAL